MSLPPLSPRGASVLKTLIETYLQEGEPVGSRLLAKRYPESLSSATIRNVLSDLEEEDLVTQPHTSAGRVPTERAWRYYIERWAGLHQAPAAELEAALVPTLEGLDMDPEAWTRHASRVLAEAMEGVCLALPPSLRESRMVRLELVPLPPRKVVAVWVGSLGEVEHRVLENSLDLPDTALVELGNFATHHYAGLTLPQLQAQILEALREGRAEGEALHQRLAAFTLPLERNEGAEPALVVSGLNRLGRFPEFEDLARFRALVAAFEEHGRLASLLADFAAEASQEVQLLLGSENPILPTLPLSTAVRVVNLGSSGYVTFALVGPLRTDYARLLGGLRWWGQAVEQRQGQG
jgi:heat-inducible transcriptional repressor